MSTPTLAEFRAHLNVPTGADTDNDAERTRILNAAIKLVERHVGPLDSQTVTDEEHYVGGYDTALWLHNGSSPVTAVTSATTRTYAGDSGTEYVTADLTVSKNGRLRINEGTAWYGDVTVTYTAGYDTVPADLHLAVLIVAAHLWQTQRGGTSRGRTFDSSPDEVGLVGSGFALPNAAVELMRPYILPTFT